MTLFNESRLADIWVKQQAVQHAIRMTMFDPPQPALSLLEDELPWLLELVDHVLTSHKESGEIYERRIGELQERVKELEAELEQARIIGHHYMMRVVQHD